MKKITALILLFLYTLSVEGVRLHRHFCGGEIAEVSYFTHPDEEDCCGTERCDDCYDDHLMFKIKTEHVYKTQAKVFEFVAIQSSAPNEDVKHVYLRLIEVQDPLLRNLEDKLPPPDPIYLTQCRWLI